MKAQTSILTLAAVAILSAVAPAGRAETMDYRDLARRLAARRASLTQGAIRCESYQLIASAAAYKAFGEKLAGFRSGVQPGEAAAAARAWARSGGVRPLTAYRYRWFYRLDKKPRWRIRQERITDYAPAGADGHHHREGDDHGEGVEVLDVRDMEFDGQTVRSAINRKAVKLRAPGDEPQLQELDPGMRPWGMLASQGLSPAQEGVAEVAGRLATLKITTRRGQSVASEFYELDRSLGYAPLRVRQIVNGKIAVEALYVCIDDGAAAVTPAIACLGQYRPSGNVVVTLWILNEWKRRLDPKDLRATLPPRYELVDERFGYSVLSTPVGDWSTPSVDPTADSTVSSAARKDPGESGDKGIGWILAIAAATAIALGIAVWLWKGRGKSPDKSQ